MLEGEKRGDKLSKAMRTLTTFIDELQLMDLPLHGGGGTSRGETDNQCLGLIDFSFRENGKNISRISGKYG